MFLTGGQNDGSDTRGYMMGEPLAAHSFPIPLLWARFMEFVVQAGSDHDVPVLSSTGVMVEDLNTVVSLLLILHQ